MLHDPCTGRFTGPSKTAEQRFWGKVKKTDKCWLWTAAKTELGYGVFWDGNRLTNAYRFSYELGVGPIPEGLHVDHLCRNPSCVNPAHLEPVTHQVNCARGNAGKATGAKNLAKTHCANGHEFSAENTYITPSSGARACRKCRQRWRKEQKSKMKVKT